MHGYQKVLKNITSKNRYWIYPKWPKTMSDKFNIFEWYHNHKWYFSILFDSHPWFTIINFKYDSKIFFITNGWLKKNIRVNPTSGKNEYLFSILHSKLKDIIKSPTSWSSVRSCLEVMIELYSNVCFNLLVHSVETSPKTHKVCYMHSYKDTPPITNKMLSCLYP